MHNNGMVPRGPGELRGFGDMTGAPRKPQCCGRLSLHIDVNKRYG